MPGIPTHHVVSTTAKVLNGDVSFPNHFQKPHPPRRIQRRENPSRDAYRFFSARGSSSTGFPTATLQTSQRQSHQQGYLPFNREYNARLPYCETFNIAGTIAGPVSIGTYSFSLNNTYDPRYDIGGHQPLQYDTLAANYQRVWDESALVELTFTNPTADGSWVGFRLSTTLDPVNTFGQTLSYLQELGDTQMRPMNNTGSQTETFRFRVDNANLLGLTKAQFANLDYAHATNGNPTVWTLLQPFTIASGAADSTVTCSVKIVYHSRFTGYISQAQS